MPRAHFANETIHPRRLPLEDAKPAVRHEVHAFARVALPEHKLTGREANPFNLLHQTRQRLIIERAQKLERAQQRSTVLGLGRRAGNPH